MKARNRLVQLVFFFLTFYWNIVILQYCVLFCCVLFSYAYTYGGGVIYSLSCTRLFCSPMDGASQAPLSMVFPRQEHWSGLSFPSPGDHPDPGIKPPSPALAGRFSTPEPPRKPIHTHRFPLFGFPSHLSHLGAEFPVLYRRFSLVIYV